MWNLIIAVSNLLDAMFRTATALTAFYILLKVAVWMMVNTSPLF